MSTCGGHPTSQWSWRGLEPGPKRALGRTGATRGGRPRRVPTFKTHVPFDLEPSPLEDVSGGHWKRAQEWDGLHQTATKFQGLLLMGNPCSHSGIDHRQSGARGRSCVSNWGLPHRIGSAGASDRAQLFPGSEQIGKFLTIRWEPK